jgi:hypothetical protein
VTRKLGDTITYDFTTHNPATGAVSDADSTPTYEVFEDDNDTEILSGNATKRTGKTGDYRVSIAATSGNGFEIGKSYNVIVAATVNSIAAKSRIAAFTLDGKRINDLHDLAQSDILSDATPFAGANVAAITAVKAKTDNLPADPASESGTLAKETTVLLLPAATDAQLSGTHGAGSWEGSTPPTPAEIEAYLANIHGDGSWEKKAEFEV